MSAPEVEALVEVAARILIGADPNWKPTGDLTGQAWNEAKDDARAVLAAVAEPLMALGGERLAEVEAERDGALESARKLFVETRDLRIRAERAEAERDRARLSRDAAKRTVVRQIRARKEAQAELADVMQQQPFRVAEANRLRAERAEAKIESNRELAAKWLADAATRAERAEADLSAAEQRGAERAMAVIRERLDKATLHNVNPTEGYALWAVTLRDLDPILDNALRADRLATQAADPASDPTDGD